MCGNVINSQVHDVDIDHVIAMTQFGPDDESNWGLTHRACNRSKGARDLRLQKILVRFKNDVDRHIAVTSTNQGGNFTLHEALGEFASSRQEVGVKIHNDRIKVSWNDDAKPVSETYPLMDEPGYPAVRSFVARLPFSCLHHDHETNPRSIVDLEPMIEEFYSRYPQLQRLFLPTSLVQCGVASDRE